MMPPPPLGRMFSPFGGGAAAEGFDGRPAEEDERLGGISSSCSESRDDFDVSESPGHDVRDTVANMRFQENVRIILASKPKKYRQAERATGIV